MSEAEIAEAIAIADADQFIGALPHGLDTIIAIAAWRYPTVNDDESRSRGRCCAAHDCWCSTRRPTTSIQPVRLACLMPPRELRHRTTALIVAHRIATIRWADLLRYRGRQGHRMRRLDALSARPAGRFRAMREAPGTIGSWHDHREKRARLPGFRLDFSERSIAKTRSARAFEVLCTEEVDPSSMRIDGT